MLTNSCYYEIVIVSLLTSILPKTDIKLMMLKTLFIVVDTQNKRHQIIDIKKHAIGQNITGAWHIK